MIHVIIIFNKWGFPDRGKGILLSPETRTISCRHARPRHSHFCSSRGVFHWPASPYTRCAGLSDAVTCIDIMAAFDDGLDRMDDGVDMLWISLGGPASPYFADLMSIGAFHAMKKGIFVSMHGSWERRHDVYRG